MPALILVRFEGLPHEPASVVEVVAGRYDVANWRETTLLLAAASFMKLESDSTLKVRSPTVWTQSSFGPQEAEPRPLTTRDVDICAGQTGYHQVGQGRHLDLVKRWSRLGLKPATDLVASFR